MGFDYLQGKNWNEITRDERYFCSHLYHEINKDVNSFVHWLSFNSIYDFTEKELNSEWEIGFEVCFYRDFINYFEKENKSSLLKSTNTLTNKYSPKRTFDLCLFGPNHIIIIEAKAQGRFHTEQNEEFVEDKTLVKNLTRSENLKVGLIALASSKYFENMRAYKKQLPDVISNNYMHWKQLYETYNNSALIDADNSYNK